MRLISVAGVMGVGKSTVAEKLTDAFDCPGIWEEHTTRCRERFFKDPQRWALAHQCEYVSRNADNFLSAEMSDVSGRDVCPNKKPIFISDCLLSLSGAYSACTMSASEFAVFNLMFSKLAGMSWLPDIIIYLTRSADGTLERIHQRGRPNEEEITTRLLGELEKNIGFIIDRHDKIWRPKTPIARFEREDDKDFDIDQIVEMIDFCKQHGFGPGGWEESQ